MEINVPKYLNGVFLLFYLFFPKINRGITYPILIIISKIIIPVCNQTKRLRGTKNISQNYLSLSVTPTMS